MRRDYKETRQMQVADYIRCYVSNDIRSQFAAEMRKWEGKYDPGAFYRVGVMRIWHDQAEGK